MNFCVERRDVSSFVPRRILWIGRRRSSALCAPQKSSTHSMFHRPLLDLRDPFPSFSSTPLAMTGIRRLPCAAPPEGMLFGHLAESTPLTGHMNPRPALTSAARRSTTPRGDTASTSRTTTLPPQSQPPKKSDGLQQQAAASGGPHQTSVVNPCLSADVWSSTRKLVRGTESISSVEGTLSRG